MPEQRAIQVRLDAALLESFRAYAEQQGRSMAGVLHRWIEAAVAGMDVDLPGPAAAAVSSGLTAGHHEELLADLLTEAKAQTALLQALVSQAPTTPHGGTGQTPVVVTEPEVARPQPERFTLQDLGPGLAGADATPRRQATDADLVVKARVWIRPWGCWGEVLEAPAGPGGPAYVRGDEGSRMATHFGANQLEVAIEAQEPQADG
jgi:hypothetical protein